MLTGLRRLERYIPISPIYTVSKKVTTFLADRTNGRAIATLFRLSVCLSSVCDVMYRG